MCLSHRAADDITASLHFHRPYEEAPALHTQLFSIYHRRTCPFLCVQCQRSACTVQHVTMGASDNGYRHTNGRVRLHVTLAGNITAARVCCEQRAPLRHRLLSPLEAQPGARTLSPSAHVGIHSGRKNANVLPPRPQEEEGMTC